MTPTRWEKVKDILEQAIQYDGTAQDVFLSRECANDKSLFNEVQSLLAIEKESSGFLELVSQDKNIFESASNSLGVNISKEYSLTIGTNFLGKYQVQRLIGSGGMGQVYQVYHVDLEKMFALKVLNPYLMKDSEAIERFQREAQIAARIEHPNTVRVFDYGVDEDRCYLVMEYLEGESLRERLKKSNRMVPTQIIPFLEQVCSAINFLHSKGVIHRDLKPDNIFFHQHNGEEIIKILDFGIAKPNTTTLKTLTHYGSICGTPHYMSPEQCKGEKLDARSDIYSLGVILYEILAGHRPFEAEGVLSVMYSQVNILPPELCSILPDISPATSQIIMRVLSKDSHQRYFSANEVFEAFRLSIVDPATITLKMVSGNLNINSISESDNSTLFFVSHNKKFFWNKYFRFFKTRYSVPVYLTAILVICSTVFLMSSSYFNILNAEQKKKPIDILHNKDSVELKNRNFILIQGGEFRIGRNPEDCKGLLNCRIEKDESPSHLIKLAPYYLSKYEVTNKEYREFVITKKYPAPKSWNSINYPMGTDDIPVTGVTWYDANAYCEWISKKENLKFRLPTEEEWEHAARGNDSRLFPWGNNWDNKFTNANKAYLKNIIPISIKTSPNNTQDQSPFGIFAMAGNVREWTNSDFNLYPGSSYKPQNRDLDCKVLRGGSFLVIPSGSRTTFRAWKLPADSDVDIGFRVAATSSETN